MLVHWVSSLRQFNLDNEFNIAKRDAGEAVVQMPGAVDLCEVRDWDAYGEGGKGEIPRVV